MARSEDQEHLPAGFVRVGYNESSENYLFKDAKGSLWKGEEGSYYGGSMKRINPNHSRMEMERPQAFANPSCPASSSISSAQTFQDILGPQHITKAEHSNPRKDKSASSKTPSGKIRSSGSNKKSSSPKKSSGLFALFGRK